MSGTKDLRSIALEIQRLAHEARRIQAAILTLESRVTAAISSLADLDGETARQARSLADQALTELRNAHYGAMIGYVTTSEELIQASAK